MMTTLPRLFFVAILVLTTSAAEAHSAHTSVTEVEWNKESQRFEVAMKLQIADLQDAISARQGKRVRVDGNGFANAALNYLAENFSATFAEGQKCRLRWVGLELELHDAWLYFEAEPVNEQPAVRNQVAATSTGPDRVKTWDELFDVAEQTSGGFKTTGRFGNRSVCIRNAMLCDIRPDQTNLVSIRVAGVTRSVVFEHEHDSTITGSANARRSQNNAQR